MDLPATLVGNLEPFSNLGLWTQHTPHTVAWMWHLRYFARVLVPQCVKGERAAFEFAVGHSAGLPSVVLWENHRKTHRKMVVIPSGND